MTEDKEGRTSSALVKFTRKYSFSSARPSLIIFIGIIPIPTPFSMLMEELPIATSSPTVASLSSNPKCGILPLMMVKWRRIVPLRNKTGV